MICLVFELTDPNEVVHILSLGHMTLIGDRETISSKDRGEQDMMIFISLYTLLDGVCSLITTTKRSSEFDGIDSRTFGFEINRTSLGMMRILYRGRTIGAASFQEFLPALWESASAFVGQHRSLMMEGQHSGILADLDTSLAEFENAMRAYQPPIKKKPNPHRVGTDTKTFRRSRGRPAGSDD